jgi:hypothetical protein
MKKEKREKRKKKKKKKKKNEKKRKENNGKEKGRRERGVHGEVQRLHISFVDDPPYPFPQRMRTALLACLPFFFLRSWPIQFANHA